MPDRKLTVSRKEEIVKIQKIKLPPTSYLLTTSQRGFSQIILPLFLLAAIGLSVYLVQQRTNIIPFAATAAPTPPEGCVSVKLTKNDRYVAFKNADEDNVKEIKNTGPEYEMPGRSNDKFPKGEDLRKKEFKDVIYKVKTDGKEWEYGMRKPKGGDDEQKEAENTYTEQYKLVSGWGNNGDAGWEQYFKCENLGYNANENRCLRQGEDPDLTRRQQEGQSYRPKIENGIFPLASMSHFDRLGLKPNKTWIRYPDGKKIEDTNEEKVTAGSSEYKLRNFDGGRVAIYTSYKTGGAGTNDQGVPNIIGTDGAVSYAGPSFPAHKQDTADQILMFLPKDPNDKKIKCVSGSKNTGTQLLDEGKSCGKDSQCKSGDCAAGKCVGGTKTTGSACTKGGDCQSGNCTNGKCDATGSKAGASSCTNGSECQSGTCTNNKCAGGSTTTGRACNENRDCATNKCVNNQCVAASPSPSPSASAGASASPSGSASPASSTSPASSSAPVPSAGGGTTPVNLTKAEILGFRTNFEALVGRLGPATSSGNLRITSTIAKSELDSIVSELPSCPDDANVGSCIDSKFRTRFDLAKTAARLSAFYGIFNGVTGICVKSDLGLNPLITATSQSNTTGRVNLCTDRLAGTKIWMVFSGGAFMPILSTDTRFPPNPTCSTLPLDVSSHFRNAEALFKNQSGFVENTLCDGKTSVAPGGGF